MADNGLLIGIDFGTGSSKGVLVRPNGEMVAQEAREHRTSNPRPGFFEHDAEDVWWHDFTSIVEALLAKADGPIVGVCTSGIGPCQLPADADGQPLRPAILYGVDTRAYKEVAELTEKYGDDEVVRRAITNVQSNQHKVRARPIIATAISGHGTSCRMNSTHNMSGIGETSGLVSDAKSTLPNPREMTRSGKYDVAAVLRNRRSGSQTRDALEHRTQADARAARAVRGRRLSCFQNGPYENYICHAAKRRSTAAAIRNNLRSWLLRATSISPTGSPPARGSGSEIAQRSKKLTIAGLRRSSPFLAVKPSLLETSAIVGATIGVVGNTSASRSERRASIARTRAVRSRSIAI